MVKELLNRKSDEEAILGWLSNLNFNSQQNAHFGRRLQQTRVEFFHLEEYKSWLTTKKSTLLCPGGPGAGKTALAAMVVNDLNERFTDGPETGVAYIYLNSQWEESQQVENLVGSLLAQLSKGLSPFPAEVKRVFDRHHGRLARNERNRPSLKELSAALSAVVGKYSRVFIVIDALDECQTTRGCRADLISEAHNLQANNGINIFITSTCFQGIGDKFEGIASIPLRDHLLSDRWTYIQNHVSELPQFIAEDTELQNEIKATIILSRGGG